MRHIPPLPSVRVFEAAARHENFTQAAAELGMTQAAVSYQIKLLEERLGVPLFHRDKRRVTLSDAGRRVAPLVSGALDALSDAFSSIVDDDESLLKISTTHTFAANWMAPRLGLFQIERPELAVRLQTETALVDFARDDVDVAVRTGTGPWPGLKQHFLFRLHVTPMCSPDFLARNDLAAPDKLFGATRLSPGDVWWKLWFAAAGLTAPVALRSPGIRLDSQAAEGNAAMAGQGVAMLSPLMWRLELAAGRLVQPFPISVYEGPSYWLVFPEHKRNQPKIRHFREWLLAQVAEQAKAGPAEAFLPPPAPQA
ncbi:MAG TPA: transcriptional regulator GcvA [Allosphingosinicella sp.]|jgi:LysR family glycine cleavage system transcriptional activator